MKNYLENITPDSFSGKVFAYEGIKNTVTIINGPTGCKFYHSATSDNQEIRQFEFDPLAYPEIWYFGQPRVPCTYLDKRDYVYGSDEKIADIIKFLKSYIKMDLIAIINSPGAALIGDDLKGIVAGLVDVPIITEQSPGYSEAFCKGYDEAITNLLKMFIKEPREKKKKTVNIIGMSIFDKYHQGDMEELEHILKLCDIKVNTFLGVNSSILEISNVLDAELNIVISPEFAVKTSKYLKYKDADIYMHGPVIGFESTEKFIVEVCRILDADSKKALEYSEKARAKAYIHLSRLNSLTGLPKSTTFSVVGRYSLCAAYIGFLSNYFGMIPSSVGVLDEDVDSEKNRVVALLKGIEKEESLSSSVIEKPGQIVFADGNTIAKLKLENFEFSGIEISLPSIGYVDVIPKTQMGVKGSLMIVEQVINGLLF